MSVKKQVEGYCIKCKDKKFMKKTKPVIFEKTGRSGVNGLCITCNNKMFRIEGSNKITERKLSSPPPQPQKQQPIMTSIDRNNKRIVITIDFY